jgi:putative Mn2+ efflux pump MntP
VLKLLAFVLPLGLDSFAVAAAIGAKIGERWRERAEQAAGVALILLGGISSPSSSLRDSRCGGC